MSKPPSSENGMLIMAGITSLVVSRTLLYFLDGTLPWEYFWASLAGLAVSLGSIKAALVRRVPP